ncbi:alpha-L-rhamnosidase [Aestuariibacter sp. GS-14]|uniref:alpha-L-rhamnosidase n=1 Tax=Aestuariibacter sp. GS-14 TaxID=2590670 RepID=UPI00112B8BB4|nr:alpha-L-rhamnosidase [Aestuariibacter sp. GS-14]TPV59969.1 alpha-L-rhamnosidase [Aestuariibacter sp. GS-14]
MNENRRDFLKISASAVIVTALPMGCSLHSGAQSQVSKQAKSESLLVNQLGSPLHIHNQNPAFAWAFNQQSATFTQRSYRILVASAKSILLENEYDVWDSGKVPSAQSAGVVYAGPALEQQTTYYWKVQVWHNGDEGFSESNVSQWETGLFSSDDWKAQWIAAENQAQREDREFGMTWYTFPLPLGKRFEYPPKPPKQIWTRLRFSTAEQSSVELNYAIVGEIKAMEMNGEAVELPPHPDNAFGMRKPFKLQFDLPKGDFTLAVKITAQTSVFRPPYVNFASMLKITEKLTGNILRVKDGWQYATELGGWAKLDTVEPAPVEPWAPAPANYLRRTFTLKKRVKKARLYSTALGGYTLTLNGDNTSSAVLQPESSDFAKRAMYNANDVTALLKPGENVLATIVGDGWYASYVARGTRFSYGPAPLRLLAQLDIEYNDGTKERICTDDKWKVHTSPVLSSEIYDGEVYDARLELPGWNAPGFSDSGWENAQLADKPPISIVARDSQPIERTLTLSPQSVTPLDNGDYVVDYGQNFSGWVHLGMYVGMGQKVTLRFAEVLNDDGSVDQSNLRAALSRDIYIGKGAVANYEPYFTYHGFRYVQISGLDKAPAKSELTGQVIHNNLPISGKFKCGSALINRFWENTQWSQRSNFVAVPTDCPQRDERLGWTGDANVFWDTAAYNMDIGGFTRKFMTDIRDAQQENGTPPLWAPKPVPDPLPFPTPGWADGIVNLPYVAWQHYGDTAVIRDNLSAMERYLNYVVSLNEDLVWKNGRGFDFGDHLSIGYKSGRDEPTPKDLIGTAFLYRSMQQFADMAAAVGETAKAESWRNRLPLCKANFNKAFVQADGSVGNGSHCSYILAIEFGLLDADMVQKAGKKLAQAIRDAGTMLTTGFLGTPFALDALTRVDEYELICDLLLRDAYPSWGYMVKKGATTIWERWNGDVGDVAMNSYNHYALGAVTGFLYRRIAGIEGTSPGFATFKVAPILSERLGYCESEHKCVKGAINVAWTFDADLTGELSLTVPNNTKADVILPPVVKSVRTVLGENTIEMMSNEPGNLTLSANPGQYKFILN